MPSNKSAEEVKVVIDTNNLISAQINRKGSSREIYRLFLKGDIVVFTSALQLAEFKRVLAYSRIKEKFALTEEDIRQILRKFRSHAVLVYPSKIKSVVPDDPDDDKILAIAVSGKADYLISGDAHLLDLNEYKDIPIVTAQEFV